MGNRSENGKSFPTSLSLRPGSGWLITTNSLQVKQERNKDVIKTSNVKGMSGVLRNWNEPGHDNEYVNFFYLSLSPFILGRNLGP